MYEVKVLVTWCVRNLLTIQIPANMKMLEGDRGMMMMTRVNLEHLVSRNFRTPLHSTHRKSLISLVLSPTILPNQTIIILTHFYYFFNFPLMSLLLSSFPSISPPFAMYWTKHQSKSVFGSFFIYLNIEKRKNLLHCDFEFLCS